MLKPLVLQIAAKYLFSLRVLDDRIANPVSAEHIGWPALQRDSLVDRIACHDQRVLHKTAVCTHGCPGQ